MFFQLSHFLISLLISPFLIEVLNIVLSQLNRFLYIAILFTIAMHLYLIGIIVLFDLRGIEAIGVPWSRKSIVGNTVDKGGSFTLPEFYDIIDAYVHFKFLSCIQFSLIEYINGWDIYSKFSMFCEPTVIDRQLQIDIELNKIGHNFFNCLLNFEAR
jgi:hypothetical protein